MSDLYFREVSVSSVIIFLSSRISDACRESEVDRRFYALAVELSVVCFALVITVLLDILRGKSLMYSAWFHPRLLSMGTRIESSDGVIGVLFTLSVKKEGKLESQMFSRSLSSFVVSSSVCSIICRLRAIVSSTKVRSYESSESAILKLSFES
jgi:hypothetical protein